MQMRLLDIINEIDGPHGHLTLEDVEFIHIQGEVVKQIKMISAYDTSDYMMLFVTTTRDSFSVTVTERRSG